MFNKKIFIASMAAMVCVLCWVLYNTIGYLINGIKAPTIYGNGHNTFFMGMYLMAITYFAISLVITLLMSLYLIKYKKHKN